MANKEVKTDDRYHIDFSWIRYAPIMVLLGIIPLIVRLAVVELEPAVRNILGISEVTDFFSQYKSTFILIMTALMIFIIFLIFEKKQIKKDKYMIVYYVSAAVLVLMTVLSAVFSEYRQIALWGIADRFEGAIVLSAYVLIMLYTLYIFKTEEDMKYIVLPLSFLVVIVTALGFTQYIGEDFLLSSELGKSLIVPKQYEQIKSTLQPLYEERRAYGTMFHYNYIGSFTAMMIPFFGVLTLFVRDKWKKLVLGIMTVLSIALLLMSTSRAGIIGVSLSALVFIILFGKALLRKWKIVLPLGAGILVLAIGANIVTKGAIFERIPSLVQDVTELFVPTKGSIDPISTLPVQNITHENKTMTIETMGNKLVLSYENDKAVFKDQVGKEVSFDFNGSIYTTQDERFNCFAFQALSTNSTDWAMTVDGAARFYVRMTEEGVHLIDSITLEPIEIGHPETFGFKGKERIGSARGYIWSRSIPMLKETWLLGHGPDTYVLTFPQDDYLGKWAAYDVTNMVVDKPHNMYFQIGINQGMVALLAFLVLVGAYIIQSIQLYGWKSFYDTRDARGAALTLAVVGYLGAGIFNDSIVSVAPIFWILLGCGIALNFGVAKDKRSMEKSKEHATISLKTKKHIK